jgi:hypothetical protein
MSIARRVRRSAFGPIGRRHAGQALVLCLVLLFAGCLALMFMFSTGQVSSTRQRLANAADAAAWSAALWRARVMNFHAYANRAIVAQEVAIAQAVTLVSWAKYFESFTTTASVLAAPYPPVASVLAISADLARTAREITEETAGEEIAARNAYKQLLATSQEILQRSVDTFGLGAVANEVARANDSRFFAFALPDGEDAPFDRMTRRYDGDDRARLKQVVEDSLDPFVRGPRGLDLTLWLLPSLCFGNPIAGPGAWFQELKKRGGTVMAPDFERWEAGDTHSLHDWRPQRGLFGIFRGCRQVESVPLGWGAAAASDGQSAGIVGDGGLFADGFQADPGNVRDNRNAASLAEAGMSGHGYPGFSAYSGTPAVRDLDYASLANPRFPVSRVAVLARVDGEHARSANALNVGVGRLRLAENYAGGRLWALGAAEVYFRRPPGASERLEYASLYSPYWQVRLVEPSTAQRAVADGYVR